MIRTDSQTCLKGAKMIQKPTSQSQIFKQTARELEANQSDYALDRVVEKLEPKKGKVR